MSSREVEKEGSNFCESRANTSQAPAPFRDVTSRQKQRPRGPIQASPGKWDRVSLHTPPGESLPLSAPLHPGPRVPVKTSPGAAHVRKAAAPHHGRLYRAGCQPSLRPAGERDGPRAPRAPAGCRDTTWVQRGPAGRRGATGPRRARDPRGAPGGRWGREAGPGPAAPPRPALRGSSPSPRPHSLPLGLGPAARYLPALRLQLPGGPREAAAEQVLVDQGQQLPPATAAVGGHGAARVPRGETPLPLPPRGPMGNVVPGVAGGHHAGGAGEEGFVTP